jgi:hypothetical protein
MTSASNDFNSLWQDLEPKLVPQWDMTERCFYLSHADYPSLHVSAPSDALAMQAFYQALQQYVNPLPSP